MAATAQQWCFVEVFSCSSSHGSHSPVVFPHFDGSPLNQSVKTLPALSCQACKLASHLGHGVVAALVMWTPAVIGDGVDKTSDTRKKVCFVLENKGHTPSRLNFFKGEKGIISRTKQATAMYFTSKESSL